MGFFDDPLAKLAEVERGYVVPRDRRGRAPGTTRENEVGEEVDEVTGAVPGLAEVGALPVWVTPARAGRLLGMSRTTAYRHLHEGTFPVPVYRVGRHWRIPTAGILGFLGLSTACGCGARTTQELENR